MSLQFLASREYPGRLICLGRAPDDQHDVLAYALTGRSPASRARRLVQTPEGGLKTEVTDPNLLQQGNPKLLLYHCIRRLHERWFIGNGTHTDLLWQSAANERERGTQGSPLSQLVAALQIPHWVEGNRPGETIDLSSFEPDAPTFTPRISGILSQGHAAMAICKCAGGQATRSFFSTTLQPGEGLCLSTYAGTNVPSGEAIPPYQGEPLRFALDWSSPQEGAQALHQALGPKPPQPGILQPGEDFRVSVAVLFIHRSAHRVQTHLINQSERSDTT